MEKNNEKIPMITIDEYMSMSREELEEFTNWHARLVAEGVMDEDQPVIDFMGMSDEEIAQKYDFTPMEVVYERIMDKLNKAKELHRDAD